ncbi:hypothetical protein HPP92_020572 [Vanilla planifolia]|uniref:Uncharacterized protein n=1 Tax=Vanilla planifolia TaxID=51239 RepID=A0A835Q4E1_VANPL|nr:hypothetical protein HPP92_020572 [Vanilla planifolia]
MVAGLQEQSSGMYPLHELKRLFFYELPITKTQLLHFGLPKLKQSLSIALRLIYPLVGSLTASTTKPSSFHSSDSNNIAITVATSFDNFYELSYKHPVSPPISTLSYTCFPKTQFSLFRSLFFPTMASPFAPLSTMQLPTAPATPIS